MTAPSAPAEDAAPDRSRARRRAAWRWVGSALCLALLFWFVPFDAFTRALSRVGWEALGVALAGALAAHAVAAFKWGLLLAAAGLRATGIELLCAHGAGLFANNLLPSAVGGDVVRAGIVARRHRGFAVPVAAGVADRLLDLLSSLVLAGAAALWIGRELDGSARNLLRGAALVLTLGSLAGAVALYRLPLARLPAPLTRPVLRLREVFAELAAAPAASLAAFALSGLVQAALALLNARLGRECGIEVPLAVWLMVFPLAKIAALAPVSAGGLGVREAAQAALLAPFGVPAALAVAQLLVWRVVLLALGGVGGLAGLALTRSAPAAPARRA